jgi:Ca2+-binding RTX toxin-like protein
MATALLAGDIAVVGYSTSMSDGTGNPALEDTIHIVLMRDIEAGTSFFLTDRGWNGTAFSVSGSDGTYTYTAGGAMTAGTVITLSQATLSGAGVNFDFVAGEAVYMYQGTDANTPTSFLYALEAGDGNTTFNASLVNTGLTAGNTAAAHQNDVAAYAGPTTHAGSFLHNGAGVTLLNSLADSTNWTGDDQDGVNAVEQRVQTGPWLKHADFDVWGAASGGGGGIINVSGDSTVGSGINDFNTSILYNGLLNGGVNVFYHMTDIVFDTVDGKFFLVDSDLGGGHNRILQGNIADLLANPRSVPNLVTLYSDPSTAIDASNRLDNLEVDVANNIIYFTHADELRKVNYDTQNQAGTLLFRADVTAAQSPSGFVNPAGSTNNFYNDMAINFTTGHIYLSATRVGTAGTADDVVRNFIFDLSGLTTGSGTDAFQFNGTNTGTARLLPFVDNDDAYNPNAGTTYSPSTAANAAYFWAVERGALEGLAVDSATNTLYFATTEVDINHDLNAGTAPIYMGGVVARYALTGNPTGAATILFQQPAVNSGAVHGIMGDIEIDTVTGRYFVTDWNGLGANDTDQHLWTGSLSSPGTPTQFSTDINNENSLATLGMTINHAPTLTGNGLAAAVTEASSAPASGETNKPLLFNTITIADVDTTTADEITGAVVRISTNFLSDAMGLGEHQDFLRISNNISGTIGGSGINYTYSTATGAMVLTGAATVAEYKAAIELVTFSTDGDNITNYGLATTRQVAVSVSDGLSTSDEVLSSIITVTGINDAPVNNGMTGTFSGGGFFEDNGGIAQVTGITVTDVDANPASQNLVMTFSVAHGALTFLTNVTGGIVAGDITGGANGGNTVTITATQSEINATLGAANGLLYQPTANFNGNDTLTLVSNDQGFNGNDPGNSGTGTTEADTDNKTIFVSAVNDAPTVTDATQAAATILEDTPSVGGETVSTLFTASFEDETDNQSAFGGSSANTLAGIAVVGNGSNANGDWQFHNGTTFVNIGPVAQNSAFLIPNTAALRFVPTANFNGTAPTLTVHLIDSSGSAIPATGQGSVNLSGGGATGLTTRYSSGTVVLSQEVTAVNDAPVNTIVGDLNISEDDPVANVTGISITDVEANPATDLVSVTLDVDHGTLAILTNVAGGIVAGDIVSQDADTISILATINQINTTLAAAGGLTYDSDLHYFGGDTVEVTTSDLGNTGQDPVPGTGTGSDEQDVDSKTINIAAVDDPATIVADADDVDEDGTINIDVLANDSDIDTTLAVVEVDNQAIALGATITLTGSGATVKRELDGTLTYNPNDQFNYLITAAKALATGAVNDEATDTFSYELAGGETANIVVTVHGVTSPEDVLMGDGTDNVINGTGGTDFFYVMQPGTETLDGMGGNDAFLFGPHLDATDDVDGGAGTGDQLGIQGDYSGGLTLGANNLVGIETFVLLSGTDTRFGDDGLSLYDYDITTVDANVPHNGLLKVQFNTLVAGEDVSFDGSDESSGAFFFYAGQGIDTLIGGGGNDAFFFGHNGSAAAFTAADQVDGGGGVNDQLGLRGDYANLITFGSTTMENVEVLVAISSTDARFGNTGSNFHYNLKTHNDNVGATQTLSVTGAMLTATEGLTFDGSSELDGQFDIKGGKGTDVLTGGALADLLFGNEGQDNLTGGGGNDTFRYRSAADSAIGDEDQILDFTAGDKIDLTMMDANSNTAANDAFTFSNDGTFHGVAGELRAYESSPGTWFVEGDRDGGGSADFAIQVSLTNVLAPLVIGDFNL